MEYKIEKEVVYKVAGRYYKSEYVAHLWQFFAMLLISLRKLNKKKKNSQIDYSYFLAVAKL